MLLLEPVWYGWLLYAGRESWCSGSAGFIAGDLRTRRQAASRMRRVEGVWRRSPLAHRPSRRNGFTARPLSINS